MKLILCEGGDNLGKNLIIKGLCKHLNYDNVCVRHFGKPPSGMTPEETLTFQFHCFIYEAALYNKLRDINFTKYHYYDDVVIWNRTHLGEYPYATLFRNANPKVVKDKLLFFEKFHLDHYVDICDNYLIMLTADPDFFLSKEDGLSLSKTIKEKTRELELFKEAFEFSTIKNKLMIKIDHDGKFREKSDILNEVLEFVKI